MIRRRPENKWKNRRFENYYQNQKSGVVNYLKNLVKAIRSIMIKVIFSIFDLIEAVMGLDSYNFGMGRRRQDRRPMYRKNKWQGGHSENYDKKDRTSKNNQQQDVELVNVIRKTKKQIDDQVGREAQMRTKMKEEIKIDKDSKEKFRKICQVDNFVETNLALSINFADFVYDKNLSRTIIKIAVDSKNEEFKNRRFYHSKLFVKYIDRKKASMEDIEKGAIIDKDIGNIMLYLSQEKNVIFSLDNQAVRVDKLNTCIIEVRKDVNQISTLVTLDVINEENVLPLFMLIGETQIMEIKYESQEQDSTRYYFGEINRKCEYIVKCLTEVYKKIEVIIEEKSLNVE